MLETKKIGRRGLLARMGGAALLGGTLGACKPDAFQARAQKQFNFRMSLEAKFKGQKIISSAVQSFFWRGWSTELASTNRTVWDMNGEGVVADFGDNGVVVSTFVQLGEADTTRAPSPYWGERRPHRRGWLVADVLAENLLPPRQPEQDKSNWWLPLSDISTSREIDVDLGLLPLIVWFPDRLSPKSVKIVNVVGENNEGPSVLSSTVGITDNQVTQGVVSLSLPWAKEYKDMRRHLDGNIGAVNNASVASELSSSDIIRT